MFPFAVIRKHEGHIYIPQNVGGNHWVLLRIMCGDSAPVWRVECLDSLHAGRHQLMVQVAAFFTKAITKFDCHTTSTAKTHTWQLIQYNTPEVPRQRDAYSCGVCVCVNAWHLVTGHYPSYTCPLLHGMDRWRRWVFSYIMAECEPYE
jgi:Ulp1 family protease